MLRLRAPPMIEHNEFYDDGFDRALLLVVGYETVSVD